MSPPRPSATRGPRFTVAELKRDMVLVRGAISDDRSFTHYCTVMADQEGPYVASNRVEQTSLANSRKFGKFPYSPTSVRDLLRLDRLEGTLFTTGKHTSLGYISQLMKVYDRFPRSWAYICQLLASEQDKNFIGVQISGEPLFFTQFVWLLHNLQPLSDDNESEVFEKKDAALLAMLNMLQKQSVGDKIYLVSHGPDHGLRVMGQCSLMMHSPAFRAYSPLDPSSKLDMFAAMVTCMLHDVGYGAMPDASILGLPKWTHARFSHDLLKKEVYPALSAILPANLLDSALLAIKNHNMDASVSTVRFVDKWPRAKSEFPECRTDPAAKVCRDEWAQEFPGLVALDVWPDAVWERTHLEAPLETDPLLFNVRVADNMDSFLDRLLPAQQEYSGMLALKYMYSDPELVAKAGQMGKDQITREEYVSSIKRRMASLDKTDTRVNSVFEVEDQTNHLRPLSPVSVMRLVAEWGGRPSTPRSRFRIGVSKQIEKNAGEKAMQTIEMASKSAQQDFLHMYSVWIVRKFTWGSAGPGIESELANKIVRRNVKPSLEVTFRKLSEQKQLRFDEFIGEAVYQIYRFAGSALTCTVGGEPVTNVVEVKLLLEKEGAPKGPMWDSFNYNEESPEHYLTFPLRNLVLEDKNDQEHVLEGVSDDKERNLYIGLWRISTPQNG